MQQWGWVAALALAGCGTAGAPSEETWHQVMNAAASNMKRHPGSDAVAVAAKSAHALTTAAAGASTTVDCTPTLTGGCVKNYGSAPMGDSQARGESDFTGLPPDFWKSTSIGQD